jgi:hypothetical protein
MDINYSAGSANYYSSSNPNLDAYQALLPSAAAIGSTSGFPFTQIEYVPDNTTRIARQSLPGPDHTLYGAGNHDIKYFYSQPSQPELVMMFGSEVGPAQNYHKTIQIDPNECFSLQQVVNLNRFNWSASIGLGWSTSSVFAPYHFLSVINA